MKSIAAIFAVVLAAFPLAAAVLSGIQNHEEAGDPDVPAACVDPVEPSVATFRACLPADAGWSKIPASPAMKVLLGDNELTTSRWGAGSSSMTLTRPGTCADVALVTRTLDETSLPGSFMVRPIGSSDIVEHPLRSARWRGLPDRLASAEGRWIRRVPVDSPRDIEVIDASRPRLGSIDAPPLGGARVVVVASYAGCDADAREAARDEVADLVLQVVARAPDCLDPSEFAFGPDAETVQSLLTRVCIPRPSEYTFDPTPWDEGVLEDGQGGAYFYSSVTGEETLPFAAYVRVLDAPDEFHPVDPVSDTCSRCTDALEDARETRVAVAVDGAYLALTVYSQAPDPHDVDVVDVATGARALEED